MSSIETASLRDENSESESDSDDRFKAHTQRLVHIQSVLKRAPSYRTLELELLEWQERELFEYFVVVSLRKRPSRNTYLPEVSYQFPKLDRPTKQMREAEERLKAIPQFCFPDAKDWLPDPLPGRPALQLPPQAEGAACGGGADGEPGVGPIHPTDG